jgi:cytochrome c
MARAGESSSRLGRTGLIALALAASLPCVAGGPDRYDIGSTPTAAEIERVDIDVMPDGRGLPAGSGTVAAGQVLYDAACSHCHGSAGRGGPYGSLAGAPAYSPAEFAADKSLERTVGNYWPYATSLFDYIRRAMPFDKPGSLDSDEVYAVTAYLLYLNELIARSAVMDRGTLPLVEMPARQYFRAADRR